LRLTPEEQNIYSAINSIEVGSKAADFKVISLDGKSQKLSKITSPFKLVVFYSIYCPHCTEMMPQLLKVYNNFKVRGLEIIAISIDEEADIWRKYIFDNKFSWINAIEPDNETSKILTEYNIKGTPELFLTDNKLTILSRPSNAKQLEAKLNKLLK
jgi:peroxiredoxin